MQRDRETDKQTDRSWLLVMIISWTSSCRRSPSLIKLVSDCRMDLAVSEDIKTTSVHGRLVMYAQQAAVSACKNLLPKSSLFGTQQQRTENQFKKK